MMPFKHMIGDMQDNSVLICLICVSQLCELDSHPWLLFTKAMCSDIPNVNNLIEKTWKKHEHIT